MAVIVNMTDLLDPTLMARKSVDAAHLDAIQNLDDVEEMDTALGIESGIGIKQGACELVATYLDTINLHDEAITDEQLKMLIDFIKTIE